MKKPLIRQSPLGIMLSFKIKQRLVPTYSLDRVCRLIPHLLSHAPSAASGSRSPSRCIATGIFPPFERGDVFLERSELAARSFVRPDKLTHWLACLSADLYHMAGAVVQAKGRWIMNRGVLSQEIQNPMRLGRATCATWRRSATR